MPYPHEHSCRLRDPGDFQEDSFRRIKQDSLSIIIGRPKGKDTTTAQAYRYPIEDWTEGRARAHCGEHEGSFEPATKEASFSFDYFAKFETLGRNLAKIYIIDTMLNKNMWQITDEALQKALTSLIGKPLIAYPDHSGTVEVGHFIDAYKIDGYGIGLAEISDPNAWENIVSGKWKFVSPQVLAYDVSDLDSTTLLKDFAFEHVAFVSEGAIPNAQVLSTFYGEESGLRSFSAALTKSLKERKMNQATTFSAGVIPFKATSKAPEDTSWNYREADYEVDQLRRACAWYDSENPDVKASYKLPHHLPDGSVVWRGVAAAMAALMGGRGGVDIPSGDRKGVYNHLVGHYRQFDKEPPEFEGQKTNPQGEKRKMSENTQALETKLAEANTQIEKLEAANKNLRELLEKRTNMRYEAEVARLKTQVENLEADNKKLLESVGKFEVERHASKVQELLNLRSRLGFPLTNEEIDKFQGMSDEILDQLIEDTKTLTTSPSGGIPQAKFSGGRKLNATERVRLRLYGYIKDNDGEVGRE